MKDNTKRILIIGGSVLLLGSIAYYFLVYKPKHPKGTDTNDQNNQSGGDAASYLNTTDKIKAFQDWMDTQGPWVKGSDGKYNLLNKGNGYGTFGASTSTAWDTYGNEYLKPSLYDESTLATKNPTLYKNIQWLLRSNTGDLAFIIKQDAKALKKRLYQLPEDFINSWANRSRYNYYRSLAYSKDSDRPVIESYDKQKIFGLFEYNGKIYDTSFGRLRFNFNPLGKSLKVNKDTMIYSDLTMATKNKSISKGTTLKPVKATDYYADTNHGIVKLSENEYVYLNDLMS